MVIFTAVVSIYEIWYRSGMRLNETGNIQNNISRKYSNADQNDYESHKIITCLKHQKVPSMLE